MFSCLLKRRIPRMLLSSTDFYLNHDASSMNAIFDEVLGLLTQSNEDGREP